MGTEPTYEELVQRVKELEQVEVDLNRAEARLLDSENKSRAWLECSPVCTKIVDLDFNLQYMSAAGVNALHIDDITEYYGKPYPFAFYPDSFRGPMTQNLKVARDTGQIVTQDAPVTDVEGNELWFQSTLVPVKDGHGQVDYIIVVSIDTTERKQADQERARALEQLRHSQKMESIGTLAGGIAHDFNNILGVIVGNTDLALDESLGRNEVRYNLEEIQKACLRARDTVHQILSFSRQTAPEMKPLRLSGVIEESLKFVRSSLPTTIQIRQTQFSEDCTIEGDPTQINQVLINLCTNASHAMQGHGGILEVSLGTTDVDEKGKGLNPALPPGRYVVMTVTDTGHGIDPSVADRIFDPYFTTKKMGEGTGVGLSIVHGIVKSHRGGVRVRSEIGKGATFEVFLPLTEDPAIVSSSSPLALPTGTERILFVDDEEALANLGQKMLEGLGYRVTACTSSLEALELFQSRPDAYDLLLTDMTMPNMTGMDLAQKILQIRPALPIVLVTGFSDSATEEKARKLKIAAFALKPLARKELARTVRGALGPGETTKPAVSGRILIVEDDDQMRSTLRHMLEAAGHEIVEAPDGKVAARLYREEPTDLVITDLIMPEREGLELIKELRDDFPEVKIIAISGGGLLGPSSYLPIAKGFGASHTFAKPFNQGELLVAVQELL